MPYPDDFVDRIVFGDFKDIQSEIPDNGIDLVFTDPPYPKEYFHTYQYLADYCPRMMKRGASLVVI
jgi:DNA modification methylase